MVKRLAEREIDLNVSDEMIDRLAEQGFDPVYGARPLKRAIQMQLENPLAQAILSGEVGQQVSVSLHDDEIRLGN